MENYTALIGLIVAILGLVTVILSLLVTNKKMRRENELEKARLEQENEKRVNLINQEKKEQELKNEILQMSMNLLASYLDDELSKRLRTFVTADELKILDNDLKSFISQKLQILEGVSKDTSKSVRDQVEKTFSEALGINVAAHTHQAGGYSNFFSDRVERRIKAYNDANKK